MTLLGSTYLFKLQLSCRTDVENVGPFKYQKWEKNKKKSFNPLPFLKRRRNAFKFILGRFCGGDQVKVITYYLVC